MSACSFQNVTFGALSHTDENLPPINAWQPQSYPHRNHGHALKNDGSVTAKWRSISVRFQSRVNQQIINEGMTELRFS